MDIRPIHIEGIRWAGVMAFILMVLGGCVNDSSDCPGEEPGNSDSRFHLKFTIVTRNTESGHSEHKSSPTRAADIDGELEGSGYENYLNINDITYLLFDKDGGYLGDITPTAKTMSESADYSVYNVTADIDDEYFLENISGTVDFYLFVLANAKDWGISMPALSRGDKISGLFDDNKFVMTTLPVNSKLMAAAETTWPTASRQFFPMSGLQHFQVPGNMLASSSDGLAYDLTLATGKTVNLLRALTKIEIIDKINIGDNQTFNPEIDNEGIESWCRIEKVEIDGFINKGRLLPKESNWRRNGTFETQQVTVSSVPSSAGYETPTPMNADGTYDPNSWSKERCVNFNYDPFATSLRKDRCPVFSCYLFEYSQEADALKGVSIYSQPYFILTTKGYTGTDVKMESMVIPFRMATYTNGSATAANNLPALLRNHIYRYEIRSIGQKLEITWTVCEMDRASANIGFN